MFDCRKFLRFSVLVFSGVVSLAGCSTPSLRSITVTPSAGSTVMTAPGQSAQFRATGTYAQGSHPPTTTDITTMVTWSSSSPSVATINSSGMATAVASGATTITAAENGASGLEQGTSTVQVTLVTRDLTSLSLLPASQTLLNVGQTTQFTATGTYTTSPTTQDLTHLSSWGSTNTSVATINASTGLATTTVPGSTTIVATATSPTGSSVVGTATLSVTGASATGLTSITIIPSSQPITVLGQSAKFVAIGNYTGSPLRRKT